MVRCRTFLGYGHIFRKCRAKCQVFHRVVSPVQPTGAKPAFNAPPTTSAPGSFPLGIDPSSPHVRATVQAPFIARCGAHPGCSSLPPPPPPPPMANFVVDPRPFLPVGFSERIAPREPRRMRVFLGPSGVKSNENMAIAITTPPIDKEDFPEFALALHRSLQDFP